jgi:hypothetical protein
MSRTMEGSPGASAPVLSAALLARIHELNLDYVELLISERASQGCAAQLQHLPPRLLPTIASLGASSRRALAAAPFTLYSLGFEDEAFWRAACATQAQPLGQRYSSVGGGWLQGAFCELALLHAWHVATCSPLAARMVYAMPEATAHRLAATPLWQVRWIADNHSDLLAPRWPTNPAFWPDLLYFAATADAQRLRIAQLLGHQLIAAELEYAAARDGGGKRAPPPLWRSPRLRVRRLRG